jgi:GT2 family glycosyltransferase
VPRLTPSAAIVVLNWNGWRDTVECLESLFRSEYANFSVIVCDNGSTDGSLDRIRQWAEGEHATATISDRPHLFSQPFPDRSRILIVADAALAGALPPRSLVLIANSSNLGFAGGNNVGARFALERGAEFVWILNNDTVVEPNALRELVTCMQADPSIGICGTTILDYSTPDRIQTRGGFRYDPWCARCVPLICDTDDNRALTDRMDYVSGASMFVSRSFIESAGMMEESYFLYFEELDWAIRGRGLFRLGYCGEAKIYHKESKSIGCNGARQHSLTAEYFGSRNRLRITRRFWPWHIPTVLASLILSIFYRLLCRRWRHALYIFAGILGMPPQHLDALRRLHI